MAQRQTTDDIEDETFLRQLIRPEEDRLRLYSTTGWAGGYRWFRSPNVVCLEQWRQKKAQGKRTLPDGSRA